MKVYIYKDKEIETDWVFAAYKGFQELGAEIIFFTDINDIPYAPDHIVIADVEPTIGYMDKYEIYYPGPLNIPHQLNVPYYIGRRIQILPLYRCKAITVPTFFKPVEKLKQFSSGVLKNPSSLNYLVDLPDDTPIFLSEVVDLKSEWRVFVYNNSIIGMKHYSGDFSQFPDIEIIADMCKRYEEVAPIAYTLDVGLFKGGTFLIECNDFWSVGHYGLDPLIYAKMLRDRWFQLTEYRK